jgi:serine/threonine protein kinase
LANTAPSDGTNEGGHSARDLDVQKLIGSRYEVLKTLGQGGMGTVVKARNITLGKLVAIKLLNKALLVDEVSRARFGQEAQAGSALSHPNLVTIFDHGFTGDGAPYIVMEYIEGQSLDAIIREKGRLSVSEFLDTFIQAARALQYIHKKGIVHRDIKTSNLMVQQIDDERYIKLVDLGIAKVLSAESDSLQNLTVTGAVLGSPLYMSPEQCQGNVLDERSDIYSMGCVMYECTSGTTPFRGENLLQTLWKQVNEVPPPLPSPDGDSERQAKVNRITMRCLSKAAADRYQSVPDLLADLTAVAGVVHAGGPVPAAIAVEPANDALREVSRSNIELRHPGDDSRSQMNRLRQTSQLELDRKCEQPEIEQPAPPNSEWMTGAAVVLLIAVFLPCLWIGGQFTVKFVQQESAKSALSKSIEAAERSFKSGKESYGEAEKQYKDALTGASSADDVLIGRINQRLGRIDLQRGKYSSAEQFFSTAVLRLRPHMNEQKEYYLDALIGMADTLSRQGSYVKANELYDEAGPLALDWEGAAKQADVLVASARNSAARGDNAPAVTKYDRAIASYSSLEDKPNDKIAMALIESAEAGDKAGWLADAAIRAKRASGLVSSIDSQMARNDVTRRISILEEKSKAAQAVPVPVAAYVVPASTSSVSPTVSPAGPSIPLPQPLAVSPVFPAVSPYGFPTQFQQVPRTLGSPGGNLATDARALNKLGTDQQRFVRDLQQSAEARFNGVNAQLDRLRQP